jgi:hypothetical protein
VLVRNKFNISELIYEDLIDPKDKWRDIILDISQFRGEDISLIIETESLEYCDVRGELIILDKVYVGKIS